MLFATVAASCAVGHQRFGGASLGVGFSALSTSDVTTVTVTVTSSVDPSLTPIVASLAQTQQGWTGIVGGLWVGADHFAVVAKSSAGSTVYDGATDATIQDGQVTDILLFLQQAGPGAVYSESAPTIDSVTASSNAVGPGDVVVLAATATDDTAASTLRYQWTANGGTFQSGGVGASTQWTAPSNQGSYTVAITVTDTSGATATVTLVISDETTNAKGSANFGVQFNNWPVVNSMTANPDDLSAGQTTALTVTATDVENNPLAYAWSDSCGGSFSNAAVQSPTWTAPEIAPASGFCTLTVIASDGLGGSGSGALILPIGPGVTVALPPVFGVTFQDVGAPYIGQTVHMNVIASDPQSSALTFTWSFSPADPASVLGTAVSTATTSADTFSPGSPVFYTVTVTATDTLGLMSSATFQIQTASYQVTPDSDGNETVTPGSPQIVNQDGTQAFAVEANPGYTLAEAVAGTCPVGSWSGGVYTTGSITRNCTVTFLATRNTYEVTPGGDGNETVSPAAALAVDSGSAQAFIVTAKTGYTLSPAVGGTCPAGFWASGVYTTGPITEDCTVTFSATLNTYQVTPGGDGNETITPGNAQTVSYGFTQVFSVVAGTGYTLSPAVGGTCSAGSWNGGVYTTGSIVASCTVAFSATLNTYQVTPGGDGNETFTPGTTQTVAYGSGQAFTVAAKTGYTLSRIVGGTCAPGWWSAGVYTTGMVSEDCTVTFSATLNTYQVTPGGDGNETISPAAPQTVSSGAAQAFSVVAATGYTLSPVVGGTCPSGAWQGGVYTTGTIVASCSVVFSATLNTYQVTPGGDGNETITPSTVQAVDYGAMLAFTVTASTGYTLSETVGGTCPAGSWSGDIYTTGDITENCSVDFSATLNTYQVTAGGDGHETITPAMVQTVGSGATQELIVVAETGYALSSTVGGTCPAGSWNGGVYTTGAITASCTVSFNATEETYVVTPSGDGHETITPGTVQTVDYGVTQSFSVTSFTGYALSPAVGGTCSTGSWSGGTYTTGMITANCTVIFSATIDMYVVTPSGDGNETIAPGTGQTVDYGVTQSFAVSTDTGYTLSSTVGGTCPEGSWSGGTYTTGVVTASCTVFFSATLNAYQVTPSGDGNETITPGTPQAVDYGATQSFTVSAKTGYTLSLITSGTCPGGSWSGGVYTTGPIAASCTVSFSAPVSTSQVTPGGDGNEAITPSTAQTVNYGAKQAFAVAANAGYTLSATVGGTCAAGSWSGGIYTTGAVTASCTVTFSATVNSYTVTPSGDTHETFTPATAQTVTYSGTQAFTVTGKTGYTVSTTVGGTCAAGSWSGGTYTTGPITASCTVIFSAPVSTSQVTPSGDGNETITPSAAQTVSYNAKQAFTVAANTGYTLSKTVGGTCPAGSWSGSTYTTGAVTASCTVTFSATINTYKVTPSGDGHETITPAAAQTVNYGATQAFGVTVAAGYTVSQTVGGTCAAGSWSSGTYTTGPVTAACTVIFSATIDTYQVTPTGDGNESITPSAAQTVNYNAKQAFTVTANTGYTLSKTVVGTCAAGTWSGSTYTTGDVTASCTVTFSATIDTYKVTPSGDGHETFTPTGAQTVDYGAAQVFTVTANTGYTVSTAVGGTCAAGTWSGGTYTTGVVTAACTVTFGAIIDTYQVTPGGDGNETITPSTAQTVNYNAKQAFTVTANTGYTLSKTVAGSCAAGTWSGSSYTTGDVTASCTVTFSATIDTYKVTPSGDGDETFTPSGAQTVDYGATQAFTVTANTGYRVSTAVGGTCAAGSWSGGTYTTGVITAACTVTFSGIIDTYQVTPSGDGDETISPATAQTVNYDATQAFTVTANTGYTLSKTVGGTCAAGSWSGATYTTGKVTSSCAVTFSSTIDTYKVTPSGDGHETITPGTAQTVNYGSTQAFTVPGKTGYAPSKTVGGTCPAGSWSGTVYTTGTITAACTVIFSGTSCTPGVVTLASGLSGSSWIAVPPSGSPVYVDTANGILSISGGTRTTIAAAQGPITVGPGGVPYFVDVSGGHVEEYSGGTVDILATIAPNESVQSLSVNNSGNLYWANWASGGIYELTSSGAVDGLSTVGGTEVNGVRVNASGSLYWLSASLGEVFELSGSALSTLATGQGIAESTALDSSGNLYWCNFTPTTGWVAEYTAGTVVTLATNQNLPSGVVVDTTGAVYWATYSATGTILKLSGGTITTLATGQDDPRYLAIDAFNNIYWGTTTTAMEYDSCQ